MKTITLFAIGVAAIIQAGAQTGNTLATQVQASSEAARAVRYEVGERGPNHRVWHKVIAETNGLGQVEWSKNVAYVELASGMHYLDANGQWQESREEIESYPGGAITRHGSHQVIFANNLVEAGPIDMLTAEGQRLRSQVLGLYYLDSVSGKIANLGSVKDCVGTISANQVIYADAFDKVKADLRYVNRRSGLEQDIILREQLPAPEQFGLNPATTRLTVMTEFLEAPRPVIKQSESSGKSGYAAMLAEDQQLDFGGTRLVPGRAFSTEAADQNLNGTMKTVPVIKKWIEQDGRRFLFEEVILALVKEQLDALPKGTAAVPHKSKTMVAKAGRMELPPRRKPGRKSMEPMQVVVGAQPNDTKPGGTDGKKGFVLDYTTIGSSLTNYTFQSNVTYYITAPVNLVGTNYVQGGTVVKYTNYNWDQWTSGAHLTIGSTAKLVFQTDSYRQAIFTSKDDDSVGEQISGSTGTPVLLYGYAPIYFTYADRELDVHDVRISYGFYGLVVDAGTVRPVVRNSQFTHNSMALYCDIPATWQNLLIYDSWRATACFFSTIDAEHLTVDVATKIFEGGTFNVTNSLFVAASLITSTNFATTLNGANNATNASGAGVFQTGGGGAHYLASGSSYRDAGTTNISTNLLAAFQQLTTYPPPESYGDTNAPDLGFHYPKTMDWDGDGMEDGWEWRYFGNLAQTAGGDYDGDGANNYLEYLQGRNPNAGAVADNSNVTRLATFTPLK